MNAPATFLVPVAPSPTLEETVAFAVERAATAEGNAVVHFVRTVPEARSSTPRTDRQLLDRVESHARARAPASVGLETRALAAERYLADPTDHVDAFLEYGRERDVDVVIVDPNYSVDATAPSLQPIEPALSAANVRFERVPVSTDRVRHVRPELVRGTAVFVLAYAFYLVLGDPSYWFDLVTGAGVALVAAGLLRNVSFERTPDPTSAPLVAIRAVLFVPYLLWEIAKANAQFAYVVLHPSLPVDPWLDRVDAAVDDGLATTGLANSLTLTPGTLTVDADGSELVVHSLTPDTRAGLLAGGRERAIRFVFYGRAGLETPGPRERGDTTLVAGPSAETAASTAPSERVDDE